MGSSPKKEAKTQTGEPHCPRCGGLGVACFCDFDDEAFRAKGANAKGAEAAAQSGFSSEDDEDFNSICEMFGNRYTNGPKD